MSPVDCDDVLKQVWLFLDGELGEAEFEEIRVHITECGECGSRFEFQRRFLTLIEQKCQEGPLPDTLRQRLFKLLEDTDCE